MTYQCYKGNQKIKSIYFGSNKIKRIYKGSTIVWQADPYNPGTVLYESSTAGSSQSVALEEGLYEVYCIAGGGGAAGTMSSVSTGFSHFSKTYFRGCGGGSGSGFIGTIKINQGTYTITVGAGGGGAINGQAGSGGDTAIGSIVVAKGGGGAYQRSGTFSVGKGGAAPTINTSVISTTLNKAGSNGTQTTATGGGSSQGGAAVYSSYGAGGGGVYPIPGAGTGGYVKIIYKGQ